MTELDDMALVAQYAGVDPVLLAAEVNRWNAAIATVVERNGDTLVDLFRGWPELAGHPEYVGGDGFHPSSEGHARLAEVFYAALEP